MASNRGSQNRHSGRSSLRSFVIALQVMILLGISASVGVVLAMFISLSSVLPKMQDVEAPEATLIYSSDGVVLGRIFREDRTNVPLKDIPKYLREATVAAEDSRFYQHAGLDIRGIARAVYENVRGHRFSQGGSTITQQLARNVYLTQRKTVERKAQEAVLAILMERHFTKDKILELYLNRVYYGSGAFGVEAASKVYFGKDVDQLNLSQCAMLAGMPQKPSGYSPHEDLQAAINRRDMVLKQMLEQGKIDTRQRDEAKNEPLDIIPLAKGRSTYKAPHFVDYVTRQLKQRYGDDVLFSGGLRVYTTLNYKMQQIAEEALRQGVKRYEKSSRVTEGCFVAIEPATGYIRAMVGSVNPNSQYNRCTQGYGRQPGSSFKVFVYSAAFEKIGLKPTDRIENRRHAYPAGSGKWWNPKNYDGNYRSPVTVKQAIAQSINLPAIKTCKNVGVTNVIKYAQAMGIKAELEPYLPIAIGGIRGVHPIDMASAYGTFANGGVHVEPYSVIRVTNGRGEIIEDCMPEGRQVITQQTYKYMDECLRAVVVSHGGTGYKVADVREARGKTGTTNDDKDAWFIGYVPGKLVAACWVGNDDWSPMRRAYGGVVCAPVWREFMLKSIPIYDKIHKDDNQEAKKTTVKNEKKADDRNRTREADSNLNEPAYQDENAANSDSSEIKVGVCDDSGLIATPACPSYHVKTFVKGTEPTSYCTIHSSGKPASEVDQKQDDTAGNNQAETTLVTVTVCRESGLLAGTGCPRVRKRVPIGEVPNQVCDQHQNR